MNIVSWNVNGLLSAQLNMGWSLILDSAPDLILVQETRLAKDANVPGIAGYHAYFNSANRAGYWGVGIFSRVVPRSVEAAIIDHPRFNSEGRSLLATYSQLAILNLYLPHGRRDGADLPYKLQIFNLLCDFLDGWRGPSLLLVGDFNVAHSELDLARSRSNYQRTMFTAPERRALQSLLDRGLLDAVRHCHPGKSDLYSWWPYAYSARQRNVGWRLDYMLISRHLARCLCSAVHLTEVRGSDHCPVQISLDYQLKGD
jgi:exodeoxyribonuclease III